MAKTLQQIKDEYAYEYGFADWDVLESYGEDMDSHVDQVAIRYSQEQKRELVEMLEKCEQWIGSCNQYAPILKVIEKIITKYKQTERRN